MPPKKRLDKVLLELGLAPSRQKAKALIMAGQVLVDGHPITKPGWPVGAMATITAKSPPHPYVSRGGVKLTGAIDHYGLDVSGLVCLDIGASTGGFTDCLLRNGALRVYAVDVGYGQFAWELRQDDRVIVIERTNIRHMPLEKVPEPIALATIDVSFISLRLVVPPVIKFMRPEAHLLALIKPQFEVGKDQVGKGGVVRDQGLHRQVLSDLTRSFARLGLRCEKPVPSPIKGPKGNQEYFILAKLSQTSG